MTTNKTNKECEECKSKGFTYSSHYDSDMGSPDEIPCSSCHQQPEKEAPSEPSESWSEEFDKLELCECEHVDVFQTSIIKSFIRQTILSERTALVEWAKKMKDEKSYTDENEGYHDALDLVINFLTENK